MLRDQYPGLENRILSTVQLMPEMENNRFGYALGFIEKLIEGTHQLMAAIESRRVFSREFMKLKRYGGFALIAFVLLFITLFIFPSAAKDFAQAFDELPKTPQDILDVQIDEIQPGNPTNTIRDGSYYRRESDGALWGTRAPLLSCGRRRRNDGISECMA